MPDSRVRKTMVNRTMRKFVIWEFIGVGSWWEMWFTFPNLKQGCCRKIVRLVRVV
jgi:hypothetical protein